MENRAATEASVGETHTTYPQTYAYEALCSLCQQISLRPFEIPITFAAHLGRFSTASGLVACFSLLPVGLERPQVGFDRDRHRQPIPGTDGSVRKVAVRA